MKYKTKDIRKVLNKDIVNDNWTKKELDIMNWFLEVVMISGEYRAYELLNEKED